jgi:hypothetical protein
MRRALASDRRLVSGWHLATVTVIAACLAVQLSMTINGQAVLVDQQGTPLVGLPMRLLRFFTYFTIESNLLALVMAASLLLNRDRDGRVWRVARIASVVGMTVTFVVYRIALAGILDLHGAAWWTDFGFHVVAPLLTVTGWLLLGPWPRFDGRSTAAFIVWPVAWLVYVLILGAGVDWYPYPFLDAQARGYPHALLNCLLVAGLLLAVAGAVHLVDRWLGRRITDSEAPSRATAA